MKSIFESRRFPMNIVTKFSVLALVIFAVTAYDVSQEVSPAVAKPLNLERGVIGPALPADQ
jgi:hypothetical protein